VKGTSRLIRECLSVLDIGSAAFLHQSNVDPFRQVYFHNGYIYKLVLLQYETSGSLRAQDFAGEFSILQHCLGIPGVPSPVALYQNDQFKSLVMECVPGEPLAEINFSWLRLFLILTKLGIILIRLSWRGVSHNDVLPKNVLVTSDGSVSLIDFDQASRTNFFASLVRHFTGIKVGAEQMHGSLVTTFKKCLKKKLSPKTVKLLRTLLRYDDGSAMHTLSDLPDDASHKLKALLKAWRQAQLSNASSPGRRVAYYSLDVEGFHFPGERSWIERWNMLRSITDYSSKRILELGCNMGLLSCFLLKESGASAALAVDADLDIIEEAKQVSLAFGVKPILKCRDFDALNDWETELVDFKPDIVFALSVLNWIKDKQRFLNFLGCFQEIIFEGHDSIEVERRRLRAVGFKQIDVVGISERKRRILHCKK